MSSRRARPGLPCESADSAACACICHGAFGIVQRLSDVEEDLKSSTVFLSILADFYKSGYGVLTGCLRMKHGLSVRPAHEEALAAVPCIVGFVWCVFLQLQLQNFQNSGSVVGLTGWTEAVRVLWNESSSTPALEHVRRERRRRENSRDKSRL